VKPQNASLYTRRFNLLKRALIQHFGASTDDFSKDVCATDTASLRWGPEACIVAHDGSLGFTLYFRNEEDRFEMVQIVKARTCSKGGLVGIHVRQTDLDHVLDMIEKALRDGFESIYIESIDPIKGVK